MVRLCAGLALILWICFGGVSEVAAQSAAIPPLPSVLLINQASPNYPNASDIRGQQVLMLLRHFVPESQLVSDTAYRPGLADQFDHVVVVGNDAVTPIHDSVTSDLQDRTDPTMWVGYGLAQVFSDPDRRLGFAATFVESLSEPVEVRYRDGHYVTALADYYRVRIANPEVQVLASLLVAGESIPLALRRNDFWFFGALPGLDTDYPDAGIDAPTLIFADLLHDFLGQLEHEPQQALIRFEDVSVHIPPSRILDAVDVLARRSVPFVMGVIPAQRLEDGSILSLGDSTEFIQALRYAQDHGGTVALHGYHHTFGQGEDFEFWDPVSDQPPRGELWETYALKVEHGIQGLRDVGVEPMLWETPHYAASPLGYRVFGSYFSHAIEN